MNTLQRNERILLIAAGSLLLSILLMIITIPGLLNDTHPNARPHDAVVGTIVFIIIHLIFFVGYIISIWANRRRSNNRKGAYLGFGILIFFLAIFFMNVAYSFLPHKNILFVPILIFISGFCDFLTSILTFVLFFLKPQKAN